MINRRDYFRWKTSKRQWARISRDRQSFTRKWRIDSRICLSATSNSVIPQSTRSFMHSPSQTSASFTLLLHLQFSFFHLFQLYIHPLFYHFIIAFSSSSLSFSATNFYTLWFLRNVYESTLCLISKDSFECCANLIFFHLQPFLCFYFFTDLP